MGLSNSRVVQMVYVCRALRAHLYTIQVRHVSRSLQARHPRSQALPPAVHICAQFKRSTTVQVCRATQVPSVAYRGMLSPASLLVELSHVGAVCRH